MSPPPTWTPTTEGTTLGTEGSQGGVITRDESFAGRARLIHEQDEARSFHAVTASVTGWLAHHRFFDSADAANTAFEAMKPALEALGLQLHEDGPRSPQEAREGGPHLAAFLARFP